MSITKKYSSSGVTCKVTFTYPTYAADGVKTVQILGDFNNWDAFKAPKMKKGKEEFSITLELNTGRIYEFRYLLDGSRWDNDYNADNYSPAPYAGVKNSVLVLDAVPGKGKEGKAKAAKKEKAKQPKADRSAKKAGRPAKTAKTEAAPAAEKPARGRKPKAEKPVADKPAKKAGRPAKAAKTEAAPAAEKPARGRKPKAEKPVADKPAKKAGRPAKAAKTEAAPAAEKPTKGRKPKAEKPVADKPAKKAGRPAKAAKTEAAPAAEKPARGRKPKAEKPVAEKPAKKAGRPAAKTSKPSAGKDDLKLIEGVGPKIEELLNKSGVSTFAGLATASADSLRNILAGAGPRYKMHDPATWTKQATLAASGKWDELKNLQDQLVGGKKK